MEPVSPDSGISKSKICTDNSKALIVVIVLFGGITLAQIAGAMIADSVTLLVDSLSMCVDTGTYIGNLWAEVCTRDSRMEFMASGISLAFLFAVTLWGIADSIWRLAEPDEGTGGVSPTIVLAFGIGGIIFDVISFYVFCRWGKDALRPKRDTADEGARLAQARDSSPADGAPSIGTIINMRSAFLHVGADFLRSLTTTAEGVFILWLDVSDEKADAIAALVVSSTILLGTCGTGASWARQVCKLGAALKQDDQSKLQEHPDTIGVASPPRIDDCQEQGLSGHPVKL
jgi:Co/Zn/Cd efflux system component